MKPLAKLAGPSTLREAVSGQLREAIVTGALAPGALLKEVELSEALGASATPVREALVQLASEGLVEIEPNRLKRVAPLDIAGMIDLLRVQNALWRLGYIWGLDRLDENGLARLRDLARQYSQALAVSDKMAAIRCGHDFHAEMMAASGNRELMRVTLDRLPLIRRFVYLCIPQIVSPHGLQQFRNVLAALESRSLPNVLDCLDRSTQGFDDAARAAQTADPGPGPGRAAI